MTKTDQIDYAILKEALSVAECSARVLSLGVMRHAVSRHAGDVSDAELLEDIKKLYCRGALLLDKYDESFRNYKPYAEYRRQEAFFNFGQFRIRATPEGRKVFERLTQQQIPIPAKQAKRAGA